MKGDYLVHKINRYTVDYIRTPYRPRGQSVEFEKSTKERYEQSLSYPKDILMGNDDIVSKH